MNDEAPNLTEEDFAISWFSNDGTKLGELRVADLHTRRERLCPGCHAWIQFSDERFVKVEEKK